MQQIRFCDIEVSSNSAKITTPSGAEFVINGEIPYGQEGFSVRMKNGPRDTKMAILPNCANVIIVYSQDRPEEWLDAGT